MDLSLKIDIVEDISTEDFKQNYFIPQKPLLINGGIIKKTEAYRKWSIDFFKKEMGNIEVDIYDNAVIKSKTTALTSGDLKMKFADFLNIVEKNEPTTLRMFLFNGFKYKPELRKDFPKPKIFSGLLNMGFLFFGGNSTSVRMHFDIDYSNVLMTQVKGRKKVILISPKYNRFIYKLPYNSFSLVDFDNIDYKKHPALKNIKGYEFVMDEGDSLFMPSAYWHFNVYIDGGYALSYRKTAHSLKDKYNGFMNVTFRLLLDKLMTAVAKNKWTQYKINQAIKTAEKTLIIDFPEQM
ncbi:MAG: cupin-like domain-containing protein [Bacteroidetes bacterium]|mgnify:CR=1 FL=1|nr:cupin-like domain-containing protein [Bacteroidota bacterium]MCC7331475.1 cupin-like domain-containing protein [Flavobacteriales bacterium]MCZ2083310.1 cupin-like domain-containing protein [Flavobacteriales bacterium]MCZ2276312.1 cupin-like domain-containing protein [Bacteroidia bacterium]